MDSLKKNHFFTVRQPQLCSITIKVMMVVFTYVVLSSSLGGPSGTAHAQSIAGTARTSHVIGTVHAFLDCSKGSKAAQAYSIQHHYCKIARASKASQASVVPDGTTYGDCGTAYLYGTGEGWWTNYSIGGTSSQGALVAVDYTILWSGGTAGNGTSGLMIVGVPFQFGWSTTTDGFTGNGLVYAGASGHYYLWWGASATLMN